MLARVPDRRLRRRALELEAENLAAFRAAGSEYQIADSMTFHAGVYFRSGDPATAWEFVREGLRWFAENDNQSGIARALGMAAIVLLTYGDAELGARAAGATYGSFEEKGVMLAPVKVLHLPEPRDLAIERLGEARAEELFARAPTRRSSRSSPRCSPRRRPAPWRTGAEPVGGAARH